MLTGNNTDFREFLRSELFRRCRANPKYSLRAFARSLKVEPSYLSMVLGGKRVVSTKRLRLLGEKLRLPEGRVEEFVLGLQQERDRKKVEGSFLQLTLDQFEVFSDWQHYAILELTTLDSFQGSIPWIAHMLDMAEEQVTAAVDRLFRLGFLMTKPDGTWVSVTPNTTTVNFPYTAQAFRKLQRQVLEKAILALEQTPLDERDQSSVTFAIPSKLVPQAKERIKKFRRQMDSFLQKSGKRDRVYHLGVSFYPVSRKAES